MASEQASPYLVACGYRLLSLCLNRLRLTWQLVSGPLDWKARCGDTDSQAALTAALQAVTPIAEERGALFVCNICSSDSRHGLLFLHSIQASSLFCCGLSHKVFRFFFRNLSVCSFHCHRHQPQLLWHLLPQTTINLVYLDQASPSIVRTPVTIVTQALSQLMLALSETVQLYAQQYFM